ncbi:DUF1844 domain-containing protein [Nocardia nova]|uniref:DUF1844 domain-containing protein n=1 Tax=Nocardia nova TaxID=37330 RepID=UPI0033CD40A0
MSERSERTTDTAEPSLVPERSGGTSEQVGDPSAPVESTDPDGIRELADIPAVEVISRAAVMLMSSAAEKLGLADEDPDTSPRRDLDEARRVITALAGLVTSSVEYLGPHAGPIREGLQSLQRAFRESSAHPDAPGAGPGEKYTGPVY